MALRSSSAAYCSTRAVFGTIFAVAAFVEVLRVVRISLFACNNLDALSVHLNNDNNHVRQRDGHATEGIWAFLASSNNETKPSSLTVGGPFTRADGCHRLRNNQNADPKEMSCDRVGVCATIKEDEAYIDEWMDYHIALGFDHFILYDRTTDFEMGFWKRARKNPHLISLVHAPEAERPQSSSAAVVVDDWFRNCSARLRQEWNFIWAMVLETDEFLLLKQHNHIVDFLQEQGPSVAIHRYKFGTSGESLYQPLPVTLRFQYRDRNVLDLVKRITRLQQPLTNNVQNDNDNPKNGPSTYIAVIHHYQTRSKKEFIFKPTHEKVMAKLGRST